MNINIISCYRLDEKAVMTTKKGVCHLAGSLDGEIFGRVSKGQSDGLFEKTIRSRQAQDETRSSVRLDGNAAHPKISTALSSTAASFWHHRIDHINVRVIRATMGKEVYRTRCYD